MAVSRSLQPGARDPNNPRISSENLRTGARRARDKALGRGGLDNSFDLDNTFNTGSGLSSLPSKAKAAAKNLGGNFEKARTDISDRFMGGVARALGRFKAHLTDMKVGFD
ncbi:MAG: hypothetical protein GC137_01370 [Alphaproteobacteria bacterium]|nr:hypothetical protein [Alphaproteobacteria bacterium]